MTFRKTYFVTPRPGVRDKIVILTANEINRRLQSSNNATIDACTDELSKLGPTAFYLEIDAYLPSMAEIPK